MRPFHELERVSEPFFAIFFLLAGFRFELGSLMAIGGIGLAYVVARTLGLIGGGWISAHLAGMPPTVRNRVGFCLLPQAGVALGLGLLAKQKVPAVGDAVLSLVIGTTVLFEIVGPLVARWELSRAGELGPGKSSKAEHDERAPGCDGGSGKRVSVGGSSFTVESGPRQAGVGDFPVRSTWRPL